MYGKLHMDRYLNVTETRPFVIHYTHDVNADEVIFLNLFHRR
ncbi:MAG: hypothetical protein ACREQ9_24865 [Candidatus Binatia bacterium]